MPKSSKNLQNFSELRVRKSLGISKNLGNASGQCFWKTLAIFGNQFSKNFGNGSKVFFRCFYDFLKFLKNLRKSTEVFGNLRKFSETVQKYFSDVFMIYKIFGKIFGNLLSELFISRWSVAKDLSPTCFT